MVLFVALLQILDATNVELIHALFAKRMETISSMNCKQQNGSVAITIREAFYLNQLCDFIFEMRYRGLDDGYKIKIDAIFSLLTDGIDSGLITAHKIKFN